MSDDGRKYVACRAGRVNEETKYVLDYFGIQEPELVEDVRTQVRDIDLEEHLAFREIFIKDSMAHHEG